QTVEIAGASPVTQEAAAAVGLGPDAPAAIVRDIRFPRIDAAANDPNAQRFNQLVAQQPQFAPEDQTEEQVRYSIVYAGPDLISVKFDTYQNTLGAAHPDNSMKAVTVVMTGGARTLGVEDVFRPDGGWENFVTQRAMEQLTRQFREYGFAPPARDVRETATKPHLWLISDQGLTILFPPYSFGGPHAMGGAEVSIPWADLRPYLNPRAPRPIGAQA
ncbi:MAG: RsiV family protein, partial [Hyphomonadaceae bacterium]